jgi:hypothetical protein
MHASRFFGIAALVNSFTLTQAVLLGAAAPEFRCMQNRTLGFWAKSGHSIEGTGETLARKK